jgi:hypothetical protein
VAHSIKLEAEVLAGRLKEAKDDIELMKLNLLTYFYDVYEVDPRQVRFRELIEMYRQRGLDGYFKIMGL